MRDIEEAPEMCGFGDCAMSLARKRGIKTQAALIRALRAQGYDVAERTFANYLYGRTVVDPELPHYLVAVLRLNKKERRELAEAYTFGQPPRGSRMAEAG